MNIKNSTRVFEIKAICYQKDVLQYYTLKTQMAKYTISFFRVSTQMTQK